VAAGRICSGWGSGWGVGMASHRTGRYRDDVSERRSPEPASGLALPLAPPEAAARSAGGAARGYESREGLWSTRLTAGIVAGSTGSLLGVAAWLEPAADGLGTHTTLGLPRCGWVAAADIPCPTCGMTTAFAHAADGSLVTAFVTQPAGAVLALVAAMALIASTHTLVTGQSILPLLSPLFRPAGWTALGLFVLVAWIWKILSHRGYI